MLILQPFDLAVFQQGVADQPALLLEHLRGNDIRDGIHAMQSKAEQEKLAEEDARRTARAESIKRHCSNEVLDDEQKRRKARKPGYGYKQHQCTGACSALKGREEYSD